MSDKNGSSAGKHTSSNLDELEPASATKRVAIEIGKHQVAEGEEEEEAREAAEDENGEEDEEQSDDGGECTTPSVKG